MIFLCHDGICGVHLQLRPMNTNHFSSNIKTEFLDKRSKTLDTVSDFFEPE